MFLLTKACRYFYDAEAVREEHQDKNVADGVYQGGGIGAHILGQGWNGKGGHVTRHRDYNPAGRNLRNVWSIATEAFPEAHFATFPTELASRCIRAGTSERGCCAACGKPWVRVVDKAFVPQGDVSLERGIKGAPGQKPMDASNGWDGVPRGSTQAVTTGWRPSCTCGADIVPCTVLDPFAGAGTTLLVADRLQRNAIGIDLNTAYTEMAMQRCRDDAPLLTEIADAADDAYDRDMADLFAPLAAD